MILEEIIHLVTHQIDQDDIQELVMAIDEVIDDPEFTKEMYDYFSKQLGMYENTQ